MKKSLSHPNPQNRFIPEVYMRIAILFAFFAVMVFASTIVHAQEDSMPIFNSSPDENSIKTANAHYQFLPDQNALKITFEWGEWPHVMYSPDQPLDWSNWGGMAFDVTNPGKETVQFSIRVDDDAKADGIQHCSTASSDIPPGDTASFCMQFGSAPMKYGMRGLPAAFPGLKAMNGGGNDTLNMHHIVAFQIFLHNPSHPTDLIVSNFRLVPKSSLKDIVDRFGQYTGAAWPGKLTNVSELKSRLTAENQDMKAHPKPADRDRFGGWADGPKLPATGFFRTEKYKGKWGLVDPDGHLFFSAGIDCVNDSNETLVTGRESMFSWLPKPDDPLSAFYGQVNNVFMGPVKEGKTYNFFEANLYRKYGANWKNIWFKREPDRLLSWGFNTIGNWSDPYYYHDARIPFVATGGVGGSHRRISSGSDYWGKMHDPFDPQFAVDAQDSLAPLMAKVKGDPWCIGYFVDNELSWGGGSFEGGRYGLAFGALNEQKDSPAKKAFLAQLKLKYSDITKLNTAWNTQFADWQAMDSPWTLQGSMTDAMKADCGVYVHAFALKYFQVIRDVLKKGDPDHLYLGCRFAWRTPEAVQAAAEVCDVVSFNIYAPRLDPKSWAFCNDLGKPCIIGEFHFGALDRGMFHPGLVSTPNQQARAVMYQDYLHTVIDNPAFVGCHWFQFIDEPLTGRSLDGENYNIGFLNVTDTPYPEMVSAARKVHAEIYTRRWAK
jgi:hypothetical protein